MAQGKVNKEILGPKGMRLDIGPCGSSKVTLPGFHVLCKAEPLLSRQPTHEPTSCLPLVNPGDRIAQLILEKIHMLDIEQVDDGIWDPRVSQVSDVFMSPASLRKRKRH